MNYIGKSVQNCSGPELLIFFFLFKLDQRIGPQRVLLPDHHGRPPDVVVQLHGNIHVVAVVSAERVQHFDTNNVPVEQHAADDQLNNFF